MIHILPIKAFDDNYIWCLHNNQHCAVVDPGDAAPVNAFLQQQGLVLTDILITHHHWDHTDGLPTLLQHWPQVNIFGLESTRVPLVNQKVDAGQNLSLSGLPLAFDVLKLPGHTRDHLAYYHPDYLFCGDTLFSAGCGRLFEGTPEQMLNSLQQLANLPGNTAVYCTHEYTQSNVQFALAADPENPQLKQYAAWVKQQRERGLPTLPSSIEQEQKINPFLRSHTSSVIQSLQKKFAREFADEVETFAALRRWKDKF